jgi:hypothetical protein
VVIRLIPATGTRVQSQARECEICGEICGRQNGTGTDFSPSNSAFPPQWPSFGAPYSYVTHNRRHIILGIDNIFK